MRQLLLAVVLCLGLAAPLGAQPPAPRPEEVRQQALTAVQVRQQTQRLADRHAQVKARLQDRIEALRRRLEETARWRRKVRAYLADQQAKLAELERRRQEYQRIRRGLEPLLDQTLARLEAMVKADLPFLLSERRRRLEDLAGLLRDYDASLPRKSRRLLETLAVEARYGGAAGAVETEREIGGRLRRVCMLRLGRLALFALSGDGARAWRWERGERRFLPVEGYTRDLNLAAEIARRHRVASLVEIPLGRLPREVRP